MLTREEVVERIQALPPAEAARAAKLALKLYGPAPKPPNPRSRKARMWRARITERLPVPHAKQAEIEASPAKRKVICAGRRAGKTTLAARAGILAALDGKRVLLTSTSQDQADAFWEKAVAWLGEAIERKAVRKNETKRILTFVLTGGRIKVKTAREPDELRGDFCDLFVGDEAARLKSTAWSEVIAPMLADTDGEAWLISTPNRINWFFERFERGLADGARWRSWHFTTYDNPTLSAAAVAELESDMESEEAHRQEILAEFLSGEGAVFSNLDAVLTLKPSTPGEHAGHAIVMGLDWGQANDYTVPVLFCQTCMREVHIERMRRQRWETMRERVATLYWQWRVSRLTAESNSIGGPNIEELEKLDLAWFAEKVAEGDVDAGNWTADELTAPRTRALRADAFETTSDSKSQVVQALKVCFEKAKARWLADSVARGEAQAYEARVSPTTGRVTYSAPEGMHDDTVIARCLAWSAAYTQTGGFADL
jgi:hypothetical protein